MPYIYKRIYIDLGQQSLATASFLLMQSSDEDMASISLYTVGWSMMGMII